MKINKVEFDNFYSYKHGEVDFSKYNGVITIEGLNKDSGGSNGSGKSVFLEAIVYGIFGKSIRKSTEDAMVNHSVGKKCKVVIELNDNIKIVRTRKPASLKLFIDGEDCSEAHASYTQRSIEDILGTDIKTFMASCVFGQHASMDFLDATPDDKRKILNKFLNLDYIFDMKNKIKVIRSKIKREIRDKDVLIYRLEEDADDYREKVSPTSLTLVELSLLNSTSLATIVKEENLNRRCVENIETLKRKLLEYKSSNISKCRDVVKSGVGSVSTYECSECKTKLNDTIDQEFYDYCARSIDKFIKEKQELQQQVKDNESLITKPSISSVYYAKLNERKSEDTYRTLLEKVTQELSVLHESRNSLDNKHDMMGFWDKAFSEKGLVKFVIRTIKDYLNTQCSYYLGYLTNSNISVEFNEELNEKIAVGGDPRHYISLSGGEKRKLNLAVMLGLQSLLTMSNGHKSNLLFFDEVAENLDQDGINGLYNLLCELKKEKTIFIITHNPILQSLLESSKTLKVVKENGESKII